MNFEELNNKTIMECLLTFDKIVYVGTTKRTLEEECFKWLTERSVVSSKGFGFATGHLNRPVLQFEQDDGSLRVITEGEAEGVLGFQKFLVYQNSLCLNATTVEDFMQKGIDHFDLGVRLHRHVAKGKKAEDDDAADENYLVQVFVTFADYSVIDRVIPGLGKVVVVN